MSVQVNSINPWGQGHVCHILKVDGGYERNRRYGSCSRSIKYNWRKMLICNYIWYFPCNSVQFSCSVVSNTFDPMDCSTPGLPAQYQLSEFMQTHVHWVGDAIQPSPPLSSPSPPVFNLSQHQGLFKWVSSLHQVAKVLELQLQHHSFQWIFRTDLI